MPAPTRRPACATSTASPSPWPRPWSTSRGPDPVAGPPAFACADHRAGTVRGVDYTEALAYLDRHINLEKSAAIAGRVEGLKLDTMRRLVHVLGDPQRAYPVIHLTGTNGKGSTARMIAELLAAHGLSVGLYTSPHLQRVNERLWWSGEPRQRVDRDGEVIQEALTGPRRALPAEREDFVSDEDLVGLD